MNSVVLEKIEQYLGKDAAVHASSVFVSLCDVATKANDKLVATGFSTLSLVLIAFLIGYILSFIYWFVLDNVETPYVRIRRTIWSLIKMLPPVKKYIRSELLKAKQRLSDKKCNVTGSTPEEKRLLSKLRTLPQKGLSCDGVMERLDAYTRLLTKDGATWKNSKISGAVYHIREEYDDLAAKVFRHQLHANPLHFDVFEDARRCEAELVSWVWHLYNGPSDSEPCGAVTSGGTESIVLAVLACRNRLLSRCSGIKWPEIIVSSTTHVAVEKAAEMFRCRVIKVPPVMPTGQADVEGMRRRINKNTCMIFGSAPSFPWGCVDDLGAIGKLGLEYDIPVHADCCLGGFLIPFAAEAGFPFSNGPVDFRIPGVTTISVDSHKYGFAPKGSSLLLYRDQALRAHQVFVATEWPGYVSHEHLIKSIYSFLNYFRGVYATPALAGSRSGALVVAAWASVLHCGFEGYVESTRQILTIARDIREGIKKMDGIKILGLGELSVVAFEMEDSKIAGCIYLVLDKMTTRGWHLNALQYPSGLHIAVTDAHCKPGFAQGFLKDLKASVNEVLEGVKSGKIDPKSGSAAVYGTTQAIPDRSIVEDFVKQVIEDALAV